MDNRETQKPSWIRTKKGKAMLIATIATLVVVIGIVLGIHIYYMNRWYSNTWIGDREVSGMTYEESAELINRVFSTYQLKITGQSEKMTLIIKSTSKILFRKNMMSSMILFLSFPWGKEIRWILT